MTTGGGRARRRTLRTVVPIVVVLFGLVGPAASASAGHVAVRSASNVHPATTQVLSVGFSGYGIVTNNSSSVTASYATWVEPTVSCNHASARERSDFLFASGIGTYPTVFYWNHHLAIGVWAYCPAGSNATQYLPIYTHEPNVGCPGGRLFDGCIVANFTVSPGDRIVSAVTWSSSNPNRVSGYLADISRLEMFHIHLFIRGFAPIDGVCGGGHFTDQPTFSKVAIGCLLTVNGVTGGVGSFAPPNTLVVLDNKNPHGQSLTTESVLHPPGSSFSITWVRSEPS